MTFPVYNKELLFQLQEHLNNQGTQYYFDLFEKLLRNFMLNSVQLGISIGRLIVHIVLRLLSNHHHQSFYRMKISFEVQLSSHKLNQELRWAHV